MATSLYRTYRPQTFAEVVGQAHVTTTLARAVDEGRPHHAYLFTGPRGTGKTSTARILAKSLNCEAGPTSTPDGTCGQCVAIAEGSAIDVVEIDAASHGGVDDVRELRERVTFSPAAARTKVYIVDECHMLSTAGWNAFLKTVEEPPGHVVFVFATTEPHKVLPTILSRTQRFDFRRIPADVLSEHCRRICELEAVTLEPGALDLVVRAGDGSARDTLSVLDQVIAYTGRTVTLAGVTEVLGSVPEALLEELADAIGTGDVPRVCRLVQRLADSGADLRQFARDAVEHLRALFLLRAAPDADLVETTPERLARLVAQAGRLGTVELLRAVELLADAQVAMRRGAVRLPLEVALLKAALPEATGDPAALAARMDRLERRTGVDPVAATPASAPEPAPAPVEPAPPPPAPKPAPHPAAPAASADPIAPAHVASADAGANPTEPVTARPVDLEMVKASWPAVLAAVKLRSRRLNSMLNEGVPEAVDGGALALAFPGDRAFHAGEVGRADAVETLAEVFAELLGEPLRIAVRVGGDGPALPPAAFASQAADVAEAEEEDAAGRGPDPATVHARAVARIQDELGAEVLER